VLVAEIEQSAMQVTKMSKSWKILTMIHATAVEAGSPKLFLRRPWRRQHNFEAPCVDEMIHLLRHGKYGDLTAWDFSRIRLATMMLARVATSAQVLRHILPVVICIMRMMTMTTSNNPGRVIEQDLGPEEDKGLDTVTHDYETMTTKMTEGHIPKKQ